MADCPNIENARAEIIRCCRAKHLRSSTFTQDEPVEWRPHEVLNPESGIPFTDISAWHFIADQAETGCAIEVITMRNPPGLVGYEMKIKTIEGYPRLYIKVTLRGGKVRGRSFHYSILLGEDQNAK